MRTTFVLDHQPERATLHRVRALLRVETDSSQTPAARTPLNLSVVLDRSGSMAGAKLHAAREAAAFLVRRLRPDDVVSVVAFDTQVMTVAEPATGTAQADLPDHIERIPAGASTNLSGGWLRGRELASHGRAEGTLSRILLLTDGRANAGITQPSELIGLCAGARANGITTTTIGFGADYDEHLLAQMADAGGGATYYIETPEQAGAVFGEEIADLLEVGAQNVSVVIRPAAPARIALVRHGYPRRQLPDGLHLDLGDLFARVPKKVLAEFLVDAADDDSAAVDVAEVIVSGDVRNANGSVERVEVRFPIRFSPADGAATDAEIRREVLFFRAAEARREAREMREIGDYAGARGKLNDAAALLFADAAHDAELREELQDLQAMADLFAAQRVSEQDLKYMRQKEYNQARAMRQKSELIRRKYPPKDPA
jgi:Ca-activated chloride channel family protein